MIIRTLLIATGAMLLSACQPESSDDAATIAAAKAGYDAFATGDMDAWAKTQAADAKWTMPKGFPYAGVYYGPEQVIEECLHQSAHCGRTSRSSLWPFTPRAMSFSSKPR